MSDDEGPDGYGDYEELGGIEGGEEEPDELGEPDETEELGLEEDAAGTDDEDDDGEEEGADEDEPFEPAGSRATPQRARVDPILRASNKSCTVKLVPDEERMTDNRLQKAEAAYIIAMRAEQIAKHPTPFTDTGGLHDPVAIAFKELYDRRCPLKLRREVGTGPAGEIFVEEWIVRKMTLPPLTSPVPLGGTATSGGAAR